MSFNDFDVNKWWYYNIYVYCFKGFDYFIYNS